jgi:NAD-dependent dihydropyrimidine dehydrogenase PreA subunit
VPTLRLARRQALIDPAEIALIGDPLEPANPPFLLPDSYLAKESVFSRNGLFHLLFRHTQTRPHIVAERCIGCGRCAESCPQHIITLEDHKAVIHPKKCISCYCCQEMCPVHAVETGTRTTR